MSTIKRLFIGSIMMMTVLSMSVVVAPQASAAASAGDLVKISGLSSVYYLGANGKRYVFPNEATYFSWYKDFSGVVTIPQSEMEGYPLAANVVVRPGTKLIKSPSINTVYAVEPNGVLRSIVSEANATNLWGADWAKKVIDVIDSFFVNYTVGAALTLGTYPVGQLVKTSGSPDVMLLAADGTARKFSSESAFNANNYNFAYVATVPSSYVMPSTGAAIGSVEAGLTNVSQNGVATGPVSTGSGLSVAMASDSPYPQTVPTNSPVEFLKINLTAANDGAVVVTSIKLTASGLSDSTNVDAVTFYDNGVKVGTAKDINSDRIATFNFSTPISVSAGTTKSLVVKATASAAGSYALGIKAAADVNASGATVSGSFPVTGNLMSATADAAASLGTVTLGSVTTDQTATDNFGTADVMLASFDLTANNEAVLAQSIKLYNSGTNANDVVSNLQLYIDGTKVADGTYADRYVTFTLNNYKIDKSDTVLVEVKGDMGVTSVGDTVNMYIKDRGDLVFVGESYGFGAQITTASLVNLDGATDGIKVTLTAGDFSIAMDKSSATGTPSKDVKPGDNEVALATLTLRSNGENATVSQIVDSGADDFELQGAGLEAAELENVKMVDVATGGVYDITATFNVNKYTLSMTDEISLTKGVNKTFIIKADLTDTIDADNTIKVVLDGAAMDVEGDVSGASITNITPSSVSGSTITVKEASLTLEKVALTNVNVVGSASDVVVYKAMLKAGTADGIKLQTVKLTTVADASDTFADGNIVEFKLYLNGNLLRTVSNGIVEAVGALDTISFGSLNTSYNTIAAGAEVPLEVKATFASTLSPVGIFTLQVAAAGSVTSRSVDGNNSVTTTGSITGASRQVTTVAAGTLMVELATASAKANRDAFLLAGSTTPVDRYMGELKFTTANEDINLTKLLLVDNGTADNGDISQVKLLDKNGAVVATQTVSGNGDVSFDPINITLPADETTSLFISAVAKSMNADGDPSGTAVYGHTVQYNIKPVAGVAAKGVDSGTDVTLDVDAGGGLAAGEWSMAAVKSRTNVVVGSRLNTLVNALSDGSLVGGTNKTIAKYTFVFENGANRTAANDELKAIMDKLVLTVSKSSDVALTAVQASIEGTATKVSADTLTTIGAGSTAGSATWNAATLQGLTDGGKVDGSITLVITATVTPSVADAEYVQTSIADLNGAGGDDFQYIGNGTVGSSALANMNLPVTDVTGGTLSE